MTFDNFVTIKGICLNVGWKATNGGKKLDLFLYKEKSLSCESGYLTMLFQL